MVGLLDIAPSTRSVRVEGNDVAVVGVSARGIAYLLQRFPALKELMAGGKNVTADEIMSTVPDAITAIIACGTGYVNNPEAEKIVDSLPVSAQLEMLGEIISLTMPKGVGPFIEQVQKTMAAFGDGSVKMPGTPSPQVSST